MSSSIKSQLTFAIEKLKASSDTPHIDAEVLLMHILKVSRAYLYTHPEHLLTAQHKKSFHVLVRKRLQGIPIAYLTGHKEFWSYDFIVNEHTLIPRPETEILVQQVLDLLPAQNNLQIADLGTGSGIIALTLAKERPNWFIHAVDNSLEALETAKKNQIALEVHNIDIYQSDWCHNLKHKTFDAIVSNPPYIDPQDPHLISGEIRFEPLSALMSEKHGLASLYEIIECGYHFLKTDGSLLLEHGFSQSENVKKHLKNSGFLHVYSIKDLADHVRVTIAKKK